MLKDLLLQKGWAGKTISRAETVDRVNPVIHRLIALNQHYDAFLRSSQGEGLDAQLASLQKTARADVGKLAETVFSCGGTPYNGTDLEPKSGAGVGFRWQSPLGPIRVDLAKPLNNADRSLRLHVSLGPDL